MKNFGLSDLRIVGPVDLDHNECREMGVGAHDLLDSARCHDDFHEAIGDATFIVGTTARPRRRRRTYPAHELSPRILDEAALPKGRVCLLFGREDFGLFAEELRICHEVMTIATSAERASMNLAQAVLLVGYELFRGAPVNAVRESRDEGPFTDHATLERLHGEIVSLAEKSGYLHPGNREAMVPSFARFLRAGPLQTRDSRHVFGLVRRLSGDLEAPDESSAE
jgi:TrmH family RNA methyltransferase